MIHWRFRCNNNVGNTPHAVWTPVAATPFIHWSKGHSSMAHSFSISPITSTLALCFFMFLPVQYNVKACPKTLTCGHQCCGVAGENTCPPCLHTDCQSKSQLLNLVCPVCHSNCDEEPCIKVRSTSTLHPSLPLPQRHPWNWGIHMLENLYEHKQHMMYYTCRCDLVCKINGLIHHPLLAREKCKQWVSNHDHAGCHF